MIQLASAQNARHLCIPVILVAILSAALCMPKAAQAHFSYSDPRIIHIAQDGPDRAEILIRMPAPLALLPDDWQGQEETRLPPFGVKSGEEVFLDTQAIKARRPELETLLKRSILIRTEGGYVQTQLEHVRFHADAARPAFGTLKSAQEAVSGPASAPSVAPYFDLTLDVALSIPSGALSRHLYITSALGRNFQVIENFGTVVKLHRHGATETRAMIGVLDVSFPAARTVWQVLGGAALLGAEHIYLGLDHLAIMALIAIAAFHWRDALALATAFTFGHMITLAAGLYGAAPAATWFIPLVELGIAVTIVAGGICIVLRRRHPLGMPSMFVIGLIHGYGFAASASQAVFAGSIDALELTAFAAGLEACQFAIYALVLPVIWLADRALPGLEIAWRKVLAACIAVLAVTTALSRLSDTTTAFGLV